MSRLPPFPAEVQAPAELPLRAALLKGLTQALPRDLFVVDLDPEGENLVTIPAKHPEVGDLTICDFGDELVVHVGRLTHAHFANYDDSLSLERKAEEIASQVLDFVQAVLRDEIEIFGNGQRGGHRERGLKPRGTLSRYFFGKKTYVWSGPLGGASDA
jgi:hypothetical protein